MGFLEFAFKALELKDLERTGWLVRKVQNPESVSDHSFFLSLLCMLYAEGEKLNTEKCVSLALVHDLHETFCGDVCSREFEHEQEMSNAEKREAEEKAIQEFSALVPEAQREHLKALSLEFLGQSSREAVFVRDLDLVEMCLQALYYKKNRRCSEDMADFFRKTEKELKTGTARGLFEGVKTEFARLKNT